jgi:hypothetical protein
MNLPPLTFSKSDSCNSFGISTIKEKKSNISNITKEKK